MKARSPLALAPSDFAFLWDECPSCFYRKVALGQPRPSAPFPTVFGSIDRSMKKAMLGRQLEDLASGSPRGRLVGADTWVKSQPYVQPGCETACVMRGRVDILIELEDGGTGIVDFKTVEVSDAHIARYARQLHAYAFALEHPATGTPRPISALGLLCFSPGHFEANGQLASLVGALRWIEVPRDDVGFDVTLGDVVSVLERPEPPVSGPQCAWCAWNERSIESCCAI
jgi:hypothetical protein